MEKACNREPERALAPRSVAFLTLGCAKNEVDTAHMRARVLEAGYAVVDDPACADAVVVNTCSFIQAATEESLEAIFDVAGLPNVESGRAALVVAGCMPARYGADLEEGASEAGAFVPCAREDDLAAVLEGLFAKLPARDEASASCTGTDAAGDESGEGASAQADAGIGSEGLAGAAGVQQAEAEAEAEAVSAYVKISDGCDRFCSYCTIPFIRGRYRSFPLEDVCAEVDAHVARGVREIVLIAQDTGRWGADFEEPSSLAALVTALAERHPRTWFRVMYVQPEGVDDALLDAVASHPNVCPYFDLPLQHVDASLLAAMNRKGSREDFLALAERIRTKVPHAVLRTTLIAGFPGETEEQFEDLCDFVEEAPFDYVGVFAYSREEGTRAFGLPGQLDADEKADRAQRLRDVADASCMPRIAARVGQEMDVLVEGREGDGQLFGRAMCQAPEVDGVVYLDAGEVGQVVRVRIVDTLLYEMEGELA